MDTNQKNFLLSLYELSDGKSTTMVNLHQIQEKTGLLYPEINLAVTVLKQHGLLEHSKTGDMVAISHEGIKEAQLLGKA